MRGYNCSVYHLLENNTLKKNSNPYCWAGIKNYYPIKDKKAIYIKEFKEKETKDYVSTIVDIIKQITPCELVTVEGTEYIKFELLKTYDQSLVLLNFIRNLWHDAYKSVYTDKTKTKEVTPEYYKVFFETLQKCKQRDPLARLTYANKVACKESGCHMQDHNNCNKPEKLKTKRVPQLLAYKGNSTAAFLTT